MYRLPIKRLISSSLIIAFSLFTLLYLVLPGLLEIWELKTIDLKYLLRDALDQNPAIDDRIAQVIVDEKAYIETQSNMWTREQYAQTLKTIFAAKAKTIGLDIYFSGFSNPFDDSLLVSAFIESDNIVHPILFNLRNKAPVSLDVYQNLHERHGLIPIDSLPSLLPDNKLLKVIGIATPVMPGIPENVLSMGYINIFHDSDGVIRKYPLFVDVGGKAFPSLPISVLCGYLNYPLNEVGVYPGKCVVFKKDYLPESFSSADIEIPVDSECRTYVNFAGKWSESFSAISSADVLLFKEFPELLEAELSDKLVFFTEVSNRSGDLGAIPIQASYPKPGIYVNLVNSVLIDDFFAEAPVYLSYIIFTALTFLILLFLLKQSILMYSISCFVLLIIFTAADCIIFIRYSYMLPYVYIFFPSAVLFLFTSIFKYYYTDRHRLILENSFKSYLPPSILQKIEDDPDFLNLGGENRRVVVFLADIRKFALIGEILTPKELIHLLNRYFSCMVEVAFKYDGTIDKFTGDEIMIIFGAPFSHDDDPLRALKMTHEMQDELDRFNKELLLEGIEPLKVGYGINYGDVVAGNIGSTRRMDYSIVGDVINKCSRIVSRALPREVLISESYYREISQYVTVEKQERFVGKEGEKAIQTFRILNFKL